MDLLVEGRLVMELKSMETILPIHEAQLLIRRVVHSARRHRRDAKDAETK